MKTKTAGQLGNDGVIDRTTSGAGGFSNEPAFPNDNSNGPTGQGGSRTWSGVTAPDNGAGGSGGVSQYAHVAGGVDANISGSDIVEQAYAKPTGGGTPAALVGDLPR